MDKCHFCSNMDTEYCKLCDKWLCKDCKNNPIRRVKGFVDEKVSDFLGRVKKNG
mgnify:CR=1 FL=1